MTGNPYSIYVGGQLFLHLVQGAAYCVGRPETMREPRTLVFRLAPRQQLGTTVHGLPGKRLAWDPRLRGCMNGSMRLKYVRCYSYPRKESVSDLASDEIIVENHR